MILEHSQDEKFHIGAVFFLRPHKTPTILTTLSSLLIYLDREREGRRGVGERKRKRKKGEEGKERKGVKGELLELFHKEEERTKREEGKTNLASFGPKSSGS